MITEHDVMHLPFLKKLPFKGSYQGMRYMLRAIKGDEGITGLNAFYWPEPFCFEATAPEQIASEVFEFTEDGIRDAIRWLNEAYQEPSNQTRWTHRIL